MKDWKTDAQTPDDKGAETLLEVVRCCKEIEDIAYKFYSSLGIASTDSESSVFWLRNAEDAWDLANYWDKAIDLARRGMLPQIFDNPEKVRNELLSIVGKMTEILSEVELCLKDPAFATTMAFKIEFYSIHKALVPLINLMKAMGGNERCPYDNFAERLDKFLAMFKSRCHFIKPEMQLLAETIQRLWTDNIALSRECYFDELTALLNRRGFYNSVLPLLCLAKRRACHVAMIVMDIDNFKQINDSDGHYRGDAVLIKAAEVIKNSIRSSDITARYGGDEFVVFCPELKKGAAAIVAEKIRANIEGCDCAGRHVTVSAGAAEIVPGVESNATEELAALFKLADTLLYEAKRNGKNRFACQKNPTAEEMRQAAGHMKETTHEF